MAPALADREANHRPQAAGGSNPEQDARLRALLAAIPDLALELDPDGRFVTWHSDRAAIPPELRNIAPGEALADHMPARIAKACLGAIDELRQTGGSGGATVALGHGPEKRWFEVSASVIDQGGYFLLLRDVTDASRQRREFQLLSQIAHRTTNIVIVTSPDRRVEWVNQAFTDLTGWTLDEVRGQIPDSFLRTEEVDPETSDLIALAISEGRQIQTEVLNYTRDGQPFWAYLDIQPLFDPGGKLTGLVAVANDVTVLRQHAQAMSRAAEEAATARAALEAAVNTLQDGFVLFDAEDRLVVCNARYRELYAQSAEMMIPGVKFEDLIRHCVEAGEYPEAIGREEHWIAERMERHHQPYSEFEQLYPDGRWLRVFEKSVTGGGHVGLYIDITRLKQAEIRAQSDLATAMEASHDGIAFTDPRGKLSYMNRSQTVMFGFLDGDNPIGQHWSKLYDSATTEWLTANALPDLLEKGHWSGELIGLARDGTLVDQDVSLTMKEDGGVLCISRDMRARRREEAERQRLHEELQIARRREIISQMVAGLAHDFSNLLTTISGNASLIEESATPGSLTEISARRVLAASDQAVVLIRRLLTLGAHRSDPILVDLNDPVRQATDLFRVSLRTPTKIHLELASAPLEAMADPTDILQLLLNLAINANDAMNGHPGEIGITLRKATSKDLDHPFVLGRIERGRQYHCLEVRDNGSGMPADIAKRAFQPYFTTKGSEGTGLGMSVVSSVVRMNKAALHLDTAPGEGTRIIILWPAGGQNRRLISNAEAITDQQGRLKGMLILLVDNDPNVLHTLTDLLEMAGAEVAATEHPKDILSSLEEYPDGWDILITDYDMPQLNGIDLAVHVCTIAPNMPIMMISSLIDSLNLPTSVIDATMAKPVDGHIFVQTIETLVHGESR